MRQGSSTLSPEEREEVLAEFSKKQEERFKRNLEKRKSSFVEKLEDKKHTQVQVEARRLRIKKLRQEVTERREQIKLLQGEIRDLKAKPNKKNGSQAA